jgi:hypothetical protein
MLFIKDLQFSEEPISGKNKWRARFQKNRLPAAAARSQRADNIVLFTMSNSGSFERQYQKNYLQKIIFLNGQNP